MHRQLSLHTLDLSIRSDIDALGAAIDRCYTTSTLRGARASLAIEILGASDIDLTTDGAFAETMLCGAHCFYRDGLLRGITTDRSIAVEYDFAGDRLRVHVDDATYRNHPHAVVIAVLRPVLQSF